MSKADKSADLIWTYEQLVKTAIDVTSDAPYWACCFDETWARVTIDGDKATLWWPEAQSGWEDSCSIETSSKEFETRLLFLSDEARKKWKLEQRAIYDQKQKQAESQRLAQAEAAERAKYEALKRKFDPR